MSKENENKNTSRRDFLRKAGTYSAASLTGAAMLMNPKPAQATANELLAQVSSGADLTVLGEESDLEVLAVEAASRSGVEIRRDLLQDLFLMDIPGEDGPVNAVLELSDGYAVVQLQGVTDGVLAEEDVLKAQSFNRRISNATGNSEAFSFMRMLRSQSEITVFEDRL